MECIRFDIVIPENSNRMAGRSRYRPIAETQTSFSDDEVEQTTYVIEEEPEIIPEIVPETEVPKIRKRGNNNERPRRPMTRSVTFDFANLHCRRRTRNW